MTVLLCISVTQEESARLERNGPRRDYLELASAVGGTILYRTAQSRRGVLGRLAGPHLRQAWIAARRLKRGDTCFADGEHIGIPLLALLFLFGKRRTRVVMLGHLVDPQWKRQLLRLTTRLTPGGTLVVHSVEQQRRIASVVARSWRVELVPYQVDTQYWTPSTSPGASKLVVAVGSENRDYETLARAVAGLEVEVRIAAGSHWARSIAGSSNPPPNLHYIEQTLPFSELRDLYGRAAIVVVPLHDVTNQSGVTVILEAMSMSKPVIVTASRGQNECIQGPVMRSAGQLDYAATSGRGPRTFGDDDALNGQTGVYVLPGDDAALGAAILALTADPELARKIGSAGRRAAETHFTLERYVSALTAILRGQARDAVVKVTANEGAPC